ncbi:hypothetical protein ACQ33O_01260 [Ferruginibacter sp. SUN002]|uniref:hypothetical protein n=1 Tax=Ferruginibacter sp. SUN002 TaxID=2937789 RepID=UPI003D35D235
MNYALYDINNSIPHKFWTFIYSVISKGRAVTKFLSRRKLKSGFVENINQRISSCYFATEGVLSELKQSEIKKDDNLIHFYKSTEKALKHFTFIYTNFEKIDFFNNSHTKELCEKTLTNFYKIEARLRVEVYSDAESIPEDKELIEIATHFSMSSLS